MSYTALVQEVILLAPETEQKVRSLLGLYAEWEADILDEDHLVAGSEFINRHLFVHTEAVDALRESLGITADAAQ